MDIFYHKDDELNGLTYIAFDKDYNFEFIPEGFNYSCDFSMHSVNKICEFFENGKRRLDKELELNQKLLLDWAKKLKDLNLEQTVDESKKLH